MKSISPANVLVLSLTQLKNTTQETLTTRTIAASMRRAFMLALDGIAGGRSRSKNRSAFAHQLVTRINRGLCSKVKKVGTEGRNACRLQQHENVCTVYLQQLNNGLWSAFKRCQAA